MVTENSHLSWLEETGFRQCPPSPPFRCDPIILRQTCVVSCKALGVLLAGRCGVGHRFVVLPERTKTPTNCSRSYSLNQFLPKEARALNTQYWESEKLNTWYNNKRQTVLKGSFSIGRARVIVSSFPFAIKNCAHALSPSPSFSFSSSSTSEKSLPLS